jgi:nucleotide-binding universal stress UspA family protein
MAKILSPTRGGEKSYPNQDYAIKLAKEIGAELLFSYVSDVTFLDQQSSPMLLDVVAELEEMGEFLLSMVQERAIKYGVNAETVVRSGDFHEVLDELIQKHEISTLVLGSSASETGLTTDDFMFALSQDLADKHGIEVLLLRNGELINSTSKSS